MSPLWAEFLGHFPKRGRQSDKGRSVDFPQQVQSTQKHNTALTVQTSLSKEYTLILVYKTEKQEMKNSNKIDLLFSSATWSSG